MPDVEVRVDARETHRQCRDEMKGSKLRWMIS